MNTKIGAIVIFFFAVVAIIIAIKHFKKDRLTTRLLFFWIAVWASIGFFALFPQYLDYIKYYLNIGNRIFFLTWSGILILFITVFYLTSVISKLNRKIDRLVREVAILTYRLDEKSGKAEKPGEPEIKVPPGDTSAESYGKDV